MEPSEPAPRPISATEQVSPPVPSARVSSRAKLPFETDLGTDADSREIAAEVASILSTDNAARSTDPSPRPLIVKLPSSRWFSDALAKLDTLPMDERPAAFQSIIEKYRTMRAAERESMRRR